MATTDWDQELGSVIRSEDFFSHLGTSMHASAKDLIEQHHKQQQEFRGCCFVLFRVGKILIFNFKKSDFFYLNRIFLIFEIFF